MLGYTIYGAPAHMVILAAVLSVLYVVLVIRFILHMRSLSSKKRDTVLLLGPRGAGKTFLWHALRDGELVDTVTSMKENESAFPIHPKFNAERVETNINFVDFPGHERLRTRVSDYYPITSRIVFLVDASDLPMLRKAAEYLHDIFSHPKISDLTPALLIACNKSDMPTASSPQVVREALEKELTQLKTTRSSLETEGDDDDQANNTIPVGRDGVPFEFAVDAPCDVNFVKCSVKNSSLKDVVSFILKA